MQSVQWVKIQTMLYMAESSCVGKPEAKKPHDIYENIWGLQAY